MFEIFLCVSVCFHLGRLSLKALVRKIRTFTSSHGKWHMLLGHKSYNSVNFLRERIVNAAIFTVLLNACSMFPDVNG